MAIKKTSFKTPNVKLDGILKILRPQLELNIEQRLPLQSVIYRIRFKNLK